MRLGRILLLVFILFGLLGPASGVAVAAAKTSANAQYGGVAGGGAGGGVLGRAAGGGTLPFTGADLAMYVVAGVAMVAAGIHLRRLANR
jgi:hypothetical protein